MKPIFLLFFAISIRGTSQIVQIKVVDERKIGKDSIEQIAELSIFNDLKNPILVPISVYFSAFKNQKGKTFSIFVDGGLQKPGRCMWVLFRGVFIGSIFMLLCLLPKLVAAFEFLRARECLLFFASPRLSARFVFLFCLGFKTKRFRIRRKGLGSCDS